MKYSDFIREKNRQGKPPTLEPRQWTRMEKERADQCICIHCGTRPAGKCSYLCMECESETGQSISSEIDNARKKCLENRDKSEI